MTATTLPPPGWYADPWRVTSWRWWDGTAWTGYTDQQYVTVAPLPRAPKPLDESIPIRAGWTAILGAVVGVVLSLLVYGVLRDLGVRRDSPALLLGAQLGLWTGLVGACVLAVRRHGTGRLRDLGLRFRAVDLPLGLGFGVATLVGVSRIAVALQGLGIEPKRESVLDPVRPGGWTVVVVLLIAVVGAPVVEELFFRGLLMGGLVARWGVPLGIVLQAVIFGLVHLGPTDARGNLGVFLVIAPVGAVLGVLRFGYKRLGPGVFTHATYNAVIMAIVLAH
jgi:membrane protease YdiL (CAAX protease family)